LVNSARTTPKKAPTQQIKIFIRKDCPRNQTDANFFCHLRNISKSFAE